MPTILDTGNGDTEWQKIMLIYRKTKSNYRFLHARSSRACKVLHEIVISRDMLDILLELCVHVMLCFILFLFLLCT